MIDSRWKCGKCHARYTTEEFIHLKNIPVIDDEPDPTAPNGHGFTSVCACGYRFLKDKWVMKSQIELPDTKLVASVSTVYLELNHGFYEKELWYETMIFLKDGNECFFQERYETKAQARKRHSEIVEMLELGHFKIKPYYDNKSELYLDESNE